MTTPGPAAMSGRARFRFGRRYPAAPPAPGFTLTELALVLMMTSVLASVGVSAYRTYSIRAELADSIVATARLRDAIAAIYRSERRPPADEQDSALRAVAPAPITRFVAQWRIVNGRLDLTYGGAALPPVAGRVLSLTPYETVDLEIVWLCGNRIPGPGLKPLGFAAGGPQPVQMATTIEARYLPPNCR